jgi:hypothetical protein
MRHAIGPGMQTEPEPASPGSGMVQKKKTTWVAASEFFRV